MREAVARLFGFKRLPVGGYKATAFGIALWYTKQGIRFDIKSNFTLMRIKLWWMERKVKKYAAEHPMPAEWDSAIWWAGEDGADLREVDL